MEHIVSAFFRNAEAFINDDELDFSVIDDERPLEGIPAEERKHWQPKTLLFKKLCDGMLRYAEDTRNEMVVSLLDEAASKEADNAAAEPDDTVLK